MFDIRQPQRGSSSMIASRFDRGSNYAQVRSEENDSDESSSGEIELTQFENEPVEEDHRQPKGLTRPSLELLEEQLLWNVWNRWEEPCLLSVLITFLSLPLLWL